MTMEMHADNAMVYFEDADRQYAAIDIQDHKVRETVRGKACMEKTMITDFADPSSIKPNLVGMDVDRQCAALDVYNDEVGETVRDKACTEKTVGIGHVCCSTCLDLYIALKNKLEDEDRKGKEMARQLAVCEVIIRNKKEEIMKSRRQLLMKLCEVEQSVREGKLDSKQRAELKEYLKVLHAEIASESLREMQL